MIREGLYRIANEYPSAKLEPLRGHSLAKFIRSDFPGKLQDLVASERVLSYFVAHGTKFPGAWAGTPWISVLDTRITSTTQRGVYAVYAFSKDGTRIFLSLGIGVTNTNIHSRRALINHIQSKYIAPRDFKNGPLNAKILGAEFSPTRFDDAQVFFAMYSTNDLPTEEQLREDLFALLELLSKIADDKDTLVMKAAGESSQEKLSEEIGSLDIEAAFARVTEADWKNKKGIEPYWHLVVDSESKPVKAVYSMLMGIDVGEFTTNTAKAFFQKQGLSCINISTSPTVHETLSLVGTWRYEDAELADARAMARTGGWASGWSFRVHPDAKPLLEPPFFVYINRGQASITARMRVDAYATAPDPTGMKSPWPAITNLDEQGTTVHSAGKAYQSWFRVTDIEVLETPLSLGDLVPYAAISKTTSSLLNQAAFGYFTLKSGPPKVCSNVAPYSIDDAMEGLFLDRETFEDALRLLREKKNLVLSGPPGVGKTYVAERLAKALLKEDAHSRIGRVQFHQSYSYEDFVQGYRPSDGGFARRNGIFHEFCEKAKASPAADFVFIIDEINRGNLSKILGEALMLIESDKRSQKWALSLAYSKPGDVDFYVPENVYIIGMMNSADRSLAIVDYALRRRFAFVALEPAIESESFSEYLASRQASPELIASIVSRMTALNKKICEDRELGPGYQIGHSFFCSYTKQDFSPDLYEKLIRFEIEPLLREYWFDISDDELQKIVQPLYI